MTIPFFRVWRTCVHLEAAPSFTGGDCAQRGGDGARAIGAAAIHDDHVRLRLAARYMCAEHSGANVVCLILHTHCSALRALADCECMLTRARMH